MENKKRDIKKNFSIPEDYFKNLEQQVLAKTTDTATVDVRNNIFKSWMAIAASVLMIFCITAAWMWSDNAQHLATSDDVELEYLEDELFAALIFDDQESSEFNSLAELADFLIELESSEIEE